MPFGGVLQRPLHRNTNRYSRNRPFPFGQCFLRKIALPVKINACFTVVAKKKPYLCDRLIMLQ